MAHGLNSILKRAPATIKSEGKTGVGSRRIFAPHFKLQVLDSYRNDADCKGNQRATARKYGIHRRQIQKWLQVEGNLRSSVIKGKSDSVMDSAPVEARKPIMEAATLNTVRQQGDCCYGVTESATDDHGPLDFTHTSLEAPMDLSLKKSVCGEPVTAPVPCSPLTPPASSSPTSLPIISPQPDVWDLSTKRKLEDEVTSSPPTQKPVKLFKPYLDDFNQENTSTSSSSDEFRPNIEVSPQNVYYYNNNNVCDIKSECTYTIQELHPKGQENVTYYYHYPPSYQPQEYEPVHFCCLNYDENYLPVAPSLKQRQSYSLDFKLSAIECYYEDAVCKGNQRAVASKYNIHRRQVQKWLKQEDELRQRCEIVRYANSVR